MFRLARFLILSLAILAPPILAHAQTGTRNTAQKQIQLRFTNSLTDKVDYYLSAPGAAPKFVGSVAARSAKDIQSTAGQVFVFAVNRKPFQQYRVRSEIFQNLTLAPKGSQRQPVVANAYQPPVGAKAANREVAADNGRQADVPPADGLKWFTLSYDDAADGSRKHQLLRGVPETDNVQMVATCSDADGGASSNILLSYDVSRLASGSRTKVRFTASGVDQSFSARVLRDQSGEGMQGASLDIPTDHAFWKVLARLNSVNYSVAGGKSLSLSLVGFTRQQANYAKTCAKLVSAPVAGAPDANPFGADSCRVASKVRSADGGAAVQMTIVNATNEYRNIDWIDFEGRQVNYAGLNAGESFVVNTWTSHPWIATDGPGNCIEIFVASEQSPTMKLTRASPSFGAE